MIKWRIIGYLWAVFAAVELISGNAELGWPLAWGAAAAFFGADLLDAVRAKRS